MRGGQRGQRLHFQPGLRDHHRRYNIDETARRRLKVALSTLKDYDEALRAALHESSPSDVDARKVIYAALVRLAHGSAGEFR